MATKGKKGGEKTGGRVAGTPNKTTRTVKEVFATVFEELQNDPNVKLSEWAKENPTDFYKLSSKLIPAAVEAKVSLTKIGLDLDEDIYE